MKCESVLVRVFPCLHGRIESVSRVCIRIDARSLSRCVPLALTIFLITVVILLPTGESLAYDHCKYLWGFPAPYCHDTLDGCARSGGHCEHEGRFILVYFIWKCNCHVPAPDAAIEAEFETYETIQDIPGVYEFHPTGEWLITGTEPDSIMATATGSMTVLFEWLEPDSSLLKATVQELSFVINGLPTGPNTVRLLAEDDPGMPFIALENVESGEQQIVQDASLIAVSWDDHGETVGLLGTVFDSETQDFAYKGTIDGYLDFDTGHWAWSVVGFENLIVAPGACCFPDGSCQVLIEDDCYASGGVPWIPILVCDPNPCPLPTGACCYADGSCVVTLEVDCDGDYWLMFDDCDPNECEEPDPEGACCYGCMECVVLTEEECSDLPNSYMWIVEEDCEPNPCPPTAIETTTWGRIKSTYR